MVIEQIKMPQLGESVTEGTISKWLVSVGDKVNKYDPLAEVMTDKVNAEVPSSFTGVVKELIAEEGETLAVGEMICTIEMEGGTPQETAALVTSDAAAQSVVVSVEPVDQGNKARYSPAVLKISQEHGIDLTKVSGTGAGGRITRKDLLKLIESGNIPVAEQNVETNKESAVVEAPTQAAAQSVSPPTASAQSVNIPVAVGDIEIPVTGIRKAIAANMLRSKHEAPHAWTMIEVDATNLVEYRNSLKDEFKKKEGFNLTFFAFFVKAVAQALKEFPQINSMWAGDKIIQKKDINISIAVATDDALYVPVIKQADEKTVKGIAREISELAVKVRTGKLRSEDMQGGTFTVNNTGSFGSVQSMGIINYPQAAILQVESIVKRPVVVNNGMIAVRDIVNLCMSLDHRVLDGLVCGRFLQRVKEILENTSKSTTSIY
ncbi:2-oxo acid dehydrogenase subunit E2 [Bacillus sp. ISL-40]|uniref:dihydrolipoamide acetyltransferase family protein n=1 Tax=unclassified Bacillus (in: firmicutes) TaxID=185979 RepID=UPI001BEA5928|nr:MULTISPECIES: dihydrolipoamide acetyltransferase family protein [unclassified Bacillus (in: firmicutes)]MBT2698673.1 2-oxo acid dehydrogenase subunit E2 [Bacillus sp. ISL-40]MBT2724817.1 2-oxo acid dehydrogenase subunit E2 [Bacillus sp. ISL-46]MBT2743516.1 2-oxo acid dehydrogenase subunit E2 [Bacillus sp. ISL-77]